MSTTDNGVTNYPDYLIELVARKLAEVSDDWDPDIGYVWVPYREDAAAILDLLGFRRRADYGILEGTLLLHTALNPNQRKYEQWVARTEWKEVD